MAESQGISGAAIAAVFAGGILAFSGVKGYKISYVAQDLIAGKDPSQDPRVSSSALTVSPVGLFTELFGNLIGGGKLAGLTTGSGSSSSVSASGGNPSSGTSEAANQSLGKQMAAAVGWTGAEWTAFNNLVMSESGWNASAANPTSNARGIAQKISGYSSNYQQGNAPQQIAWMIQYIQQRYGTPSKAWAFHLTNNWY